MRLSFEPVSFCHSGRQQVPYRSEGYAEQHSVCGTECRLKARCGHAASCPTCGSDEGCGADNYHSCMCTDCRHPPPAMCCVAGAKESASVNTWAGLESPGGKKKVSPAPRLDQTMSARMPSGFSFLLRTSRAGRASPPMPPHPPPTGKCPEVVEEQYWVSWAFYHRQGLPPNPTAISWTVGTSECFSGLIDAFLLQKFSNRKIV